MKVNLFSIKTQFWISGVLLVLPLFAFFYFFSFSYTLFNDSLRQVIVTEQVSNLLAQSTKNTIDLQRNVLIFKETASENAADKVVQIIDEVYSNIDSLKNRRLSRTETEQVNKTLGLLTEYKDNFLLVRKMRGERGRLINTHIEITNEWVEEALVDSGMLAQDVAMLHYHQLAAQSSSMGYLVSIDNKFIKSFEFHYSEMIRLAEKNTSDVVVEKVIPKLQSYNRNFQRIVALTRHYEYLINVVMTGSANEILYQAQELMAKHQTLARSTRIKATESLGEQKKRAGWLTMFGALIAVCVVAAFYIRIAAPLGRLTDVFQSLSHGNRKVLITDLSRNDEIGLLAKAADVFRTKNEQTEDLLAKTETMVEEQRVLNEYLRDEKKRAEKALSVKTEFLANMSHELRTPLNAIIGFTVRLLKKEDSLSKQQLNALQIVERNGRHLLSLINDVLDLSKMEANKLDLQIEAVDVSQLCADLIGQISIAAEDKGLHLEYDYVEVPAVQTDPVRLSQIILNVLSNAIKYTESGSVALQVSRPNIGSVVVKVTDTGLGISEEDQKRLFNRFEQFDDNSRFKVGKGTGLGLSIVSSLAKLLRISLEVDSALDVGTCFTLSIPLVYVE